MELGGVTWRGEGSCYCNNHVKVNVIGMAYRVHDEGEKCTPDLYRKMRKEETIW